MYKTAKSYGLILLVVSVSLFAVPLAQADVVTDWNITAGDIVVAAKLPLLPAYRVMATAQLAVYEAVNAITKRYPPERVTLDAAPDASVEAAAAAANRATLLKLVPSQQAAIDSAYQTALSAMLLRKLGNDSRKNRLYQAFRELGRVVRTVFLLQYLSDPQLRQQITARTNKVEAYNGFTKWLFFGGEGIIAENDPEEQEKMIKYNDLVANAVIFHNVVDQSRILAELIAEGFPVQREDVATLSPYPTAHLKRFGEYVLDPDPLPQPLTDVELALTL